MRFLPVALLGLASLATAKLSTWNDVVGNVPQCMKTCMDEYYTNAGLEDQCGSPDEASVDCLCGAQDSFDDVQEAASDLSSCISSGCDAKELQDAAKQLSGFTDRYTSLASQCSNSGSSDSSSDDTSSSEDAGSSPNGASSMVPGFNTILASSAVILLGAAL